MGRLGATGDLIFNYAKQNNLQVYSLDPSNKFCLICYENVKASGAKFEQETTGKHTRKQLKKMNNKDE